MRDTKTAAISGIPAITRQSSRRSFLKRLLGAGAGAAAACKAPYVHTAERVRLRILGSSSRVHELLRVQAERDLGISISVEARGNAAVLQKASADPAAFDVYEQATQSVRVLWQANAIQPIDKSRILDWDGISSLSKTGRATPAARIGSGDAPHKLLHIQADGSIGVPETDWLSFLPYVHNVDSFGYDSRVIAPGTPYGTESWAWLLEERNHGRVAMINEPTIGVFDAALAAQALGLMEFADIGQMTRAEIDALFEILIRKKTSGHFNGFWNSVPESVDFIASGRCAIESIFSPAVSDLNARGIPVLNAAPREGYRAWHGVMCLSSAAGGRVRDAAYDYMNWWLSGWAGAFVARQGYYISVPKRAREYLSADEWDYWYGGLAAKTDLPGPDGRVAVPAGATRRGGSYEDRTGNIAVWNTVLPAYEYTLQRWYEFLTS